jgi:hypothetical protein
MALMVTVAVLAINRTANKTAKSTGLISTSIRKVLPVRDVDGNWIGTNKPSNFASLNSQIVVSKDAISADIDNYYSASTVAQIITAVNA